LIPNNTSSKSHLPTDWFEGLVSPRTSQNLFLSKNSLVAKNTGEKFEVIEGIAKLLVPEFKDESFANELNAMEALPVYGVSYFKQEFLHSISQELFGLSRESESLSFRMVELGGGDGQFARHFLAFDQSRVFIADIGESFLKLAPDQIRKVCCDARFPCFENNTIDLAVFWVSFHHFSEKDQKKALEVAVASLKPNGMLVFFEPNSFFFPRHIMLNTFLREHVYFDDEEKPISYLDVRKYMEKMGMEEVCTRFIQPPYALEFLKKLKFWILYYVVVKFLYILDRYFVYPISKLFLGKSVKTLEKIRSFSASYFFSVFQKKES
jgi:ubiquinone/menaquinone biosynthesis C-methylase UbiE